MAAAAAVPTAALGLAAASGFTHTATARPVSKECGSRRRARADASAAGDGPSAEAQSSRRQKVAVVGAGVGGLAVAGLLAKAGHAVTVLEKNARPGGRLQSVLVDLDGRGGAGGANDGPLAETAAEAADSRRRFRFDTGPSLLLMPNKCREAFADLGENVDEHVELRRVEPAAYRVFFARGPWGLPLAVDLLYDVQRMAEQLERIEPGCSSAYLRFLANAREALVKGTENFIERDFRSFWDYANLPRLLPLLSKLSPFELLGQHHARMATYFKDPRLQALFTFQDLYVGLTPYSAPGVFSLLAATEITDGVWYPVGGFQKIQDALFSTAVKNGVDVCMSAEVQAINEYNSKVSGVTLQDGSTIAADVVVANADLPYAYSQLVPGLQAQRQAARLNKMEYSAGIISFNWALDTYLRALAHHNVFLSDDVKKSWARATGPQSLVARPNFYVHAPQRTDSSAAPAGCDAITVLLPVANLGQMEAGTAVDADAQWEALVSAARSKVLQRLQEEGVGNVEEHIVSEFVIAPPQWRDAYNLHHGAAFGLSHGLSQLAYFRPGVADHAVRGLFFVGASTRPGNGVPLVLMGARVTAARVLDHLSRMLVQS
eukprot:SM000042S15397  [mRNA]  locus=s42:729144:733456:+ [translate_table: standard]